MVNFFKGGIYALIFHVLDCFFPSLYIAFSFAKDVLVVVNS